MGLPQIIMIVLLTMGTTIHIVKHGEPRGDYNMWIGMVALVIEIVLLWWGGFWS
jgi:hypothetical protein